MWVLKAGWIHLLLSNCNLVLIYNQDIVKGVGINFSFIIAVYLCSFFTACTSQDDTVIRDIWDEPGEGWVEGVDYFLPKIDLTHWKVTLPVGNPTEVAPPEILDYANNDLLKTFMYNDSLDGSLVFYCYPGATTTNTSYSRTELREQMVSGSNETNWTFSQGGNMKGTLSVPDISKDKSGNPHRVIIMQIHGRLTNEQRELISAPDNNAPPMLKIYWTDGKVRVKTKELKDPEMGYPDLLYTDSWTDDDGHTFNQYVGTGKFDLEVNVSYDTLRVTLNGTETVEYSGIHIDKWNVFENYFKAGNYLTTLDAGAYAYVKYYNLDVTH